MRIGRKAVPTPRIAVLLWTVWVAVGVLLPAHAAADGERRAELEPGLRAVAAADGSLFLETLPEKGEGLLALSRRTTGGESATPAIRSANDDAASLRAGHWYRVPFDLLTERLQARVLAALLAGDCLGDNGWVHRVAGTPGHTASLWEIAERLTGHGENFAAIRAYNDMEDEALRPEDRLVVPAALVTADLRAAARPCAPPRPTGDLAYESEGGEDYGVYRLKPGEALYSSVVVRFTGLTTAADVNALAAEIAELNGIRDVTDIPAGRKIRIPFDQLLPEYLPSTHPRRLAYERERAATEGFQNPVLARDLEGITVILDAGHGGHDPGNTSGQIWESVYVYDVMMRLRDVLEATTAATVVATTGDAATPHPLSRDVLPISRGHAVLTSPPYPIEDSVTGVHLRWYLANSVFQHAVAGGGDANKVVFLSLHADSLHPSLRGAMIYVASASLSHGRFGKSGSVFAARREFREQPTVEYELAERRESEGLSRELANEVLAAFDRRGLAVAPEKPVRDKIIRHRRPPFVPAVLRYNAVPAKLLLEICNLNNPDDRHLIQTQAFRQQVAEAVADALVAYYGSAGPPAMQTTTAAAR
jgi:N-acetylmuramoyl-L-alanine amidase